MAKVLVSDSLSQEGLDVLAKSEGISFDYKPGMKEPELLSVIGQYDGLVIRSATQVSAKVLEAATNLKVVGRAGIGVDNVDREAASRRGIIVMNTPTGNAVTTAEHALCLLMAVARRIPYADATMKAGKWEKNKLSGRELTGKTLGVIGLGNIGRIVADRAKGLRMNVVAYDPVVTAERASELGVELVTLDELFARSDAITAHVPLNDQTRGVVNDASIAKMKDGVLLVNAARGGVYDEAALLRGLESGKIGGVGLDVFPKEPPEPSALIRHERVVATPHLGASTDEAQVRVAVEICEQIVAYLTSGTITNSVNVPSVSREMAPILGPYAALGNQLGQFLSQTNKLEPASIAVEFAGDAANLTTAPVVNATLAGVLSGFFESEANAVSAPLIARDRGIDVRVTNSSGSGKFSTRLKVTVTGKDGAVAVVAGTLAADRSSRLVSVGACEMDAHLSGAILVIENDDKPGVIGTVGTILGEANVNVARLQVGLEAKGGRATSLWALDSPLPAAVLERVRSASNVTQAAAVQIR
jgi:D-3-phosphoglycerate dehydrogenase